MGKITKIKNKVNIKSKLRTFFVLAMILLFTYVKSYVNNVSAYCSYCLIEGKNKQKPNID